MHLVTDILHPGLECIDFSTMKSTKASQLISTVHTVYELLIESETLSDLSGFSCGFNDYVEYNDNFKEMDFKFNFRAKNENR